MADNRHKSDQSKRVISKAGTSPENEQPHNQLTPETIQFYLDNPEAGKTYENNLLGIEPRIIPPYYHMYPVGVFRMVHIQGSGHPNNKSGVLLAIEIGLAGPIDITPNIRIHDSIYTIPGEEAGLSTCERRRVQYLNAEGYFDITSEPLTEDAFIQYHKGLTEFIHSNPMHHPILGIVASYNAALLRAQDEERYTRGRRNGLERR